MGAKKKYPSVHSMGAMALITLCYNNMLVHKIIDHKILSSSRKGCNNNRHETICFLVHVVVSESNEDDLHFLPYFRSVCES